MKKSIWLAPLVSLMVVTFITPHISLAQVAPAISSIGPSSIVVGGTVYVYGTNFNSNTFIVLDGANGQSITPTLISATSLSFVVPSNTSLGSHTIQINEKASSFPLSNSVSLSVIATPQPPTISYIGPTSATIGSTVYVYGANFNRYSFLVLDGASGASITPTLVSATSLSFVVPSSLSLGNHTVQVGEKGSNFPLSSSASLAVVATAQSPVISYISPNTAAVGDTVYIYGSNFDQYSFVSIDGNYGPLVATKFISATSLSFVVPSNTSLGSHSIQIGQKGSSLLNSNSISVTVANSNSQQSTNLQTSPSNTNDIQSLLQQIQTLQNQVNSLKSQTGNTATPSGNQPATGSEDVPVNACLDLSNSLTYRSRDVSTGGDVSALQDFLQAKGYLNSEPTGFFGAMTLQAVKKFQQANSINPTGFVGSLTRAKIKELSCK